MIHKIRKNEVLKCYRHRYYKGLPYRVGEYLELDIFEGMRIAVPDGFVVVDCCD